jgi:hypothetical protein
MSRAFTNKSNYTPFKAVPNQVPLTDGLATPPACDNDTPAAAGASAARAQTTASTVPANMRHIATLWTAWQQKQQLTGPNAIPDYANPALMSRLTWYQVHNWTMPYPGEHKILTPAEVPGGYVPAPESDG